MAYEEEGNDLQPSQANFGLAYSPYMAMGDPLAYARATSLPPNAPGIRVAGAQPTPIPLPTPPNIPNINPLHGGGGGGDTGPLPQQDQSNQLGGFPNIDQLLQLKQREALLAGQPTQPSAPAEAGFLPTTHGPGGALAGTSPTSAGPYQDAVNAAAKKWNIDPKQLTAQLYWESGYQNVASSAKGAKGIGQFMPGTAKKYGVDVNDPYSSIEGAAHYMSYLTKKYKGDSQRALAAYNWGEGNVDNWISGKQGWRMPAETQNYVRKITGKDIEDPNLRSREAGEVSMTGGPEGAIPGRTPGVPTEAPTMMNPRALQALYDYMKMQMIMAPIVQGSQYRRPNYWMPHEYFKQGGY